MIVLKRVLRRLVAGNSNSLQPTSSVAQPPLAVPSDGKKLNLGCGFDHREGWVNVDLHDWHKPDVLCDVTNLTAFEDQIASHALAQDILEHIHRLRCVSTLQEWNRVMKTGGLLEVRVPNVIALVGLMQRPEFDTLEGHRTLTQNLFGSQSYEGDYHYNGFTHHTMRDVLERSGFTLVNLGSHDEWLFQVTAQKMEHCPPDARLRLDGDEAFVEAMGVLDEERPHTLRMLSAGMPREVLLGH